MTNDNGLKERTESGICPGMRQRTALLFTCIVLALLGGCSTKVSLMPTPNLYAWGNFDPFENIPPSLQNNRVEVLYVTDRAPLNTTSDQVTYGYGRSRSAAFGISELTIGKDVSWEQLVKASRTKNRENDLELKVTRTTELGRFASTPPKLIEIVDPNSTTRPRMGVSSEEAASHQVAELAFNRELSARLAVTPLKEVYLFVHGFSNTFDDSIFTSGELWHFFGRRGVPIAYTWPAGSPGLLRGYTYDRESSEFTVYHLKQTLKLIAANPDVEKINIISHSRGTDVAASAIRELYLEVKDSGKSIRETMKFGTVVLAAPDMDFDVVAQRLMTERLGQLVGDHTVIYVCSEDKALAVSNWLFGGANRFGKLQSTMFSPAEIELMRKSNTSQIIDAQLANAGAFGHDYFHSNPAVSSDLILLMRYHLNPGAENARPLRVKQNGFWSIDEDYPGPPRNLDAQTSGK